MTSPPPASGHDRPNRCRESATRREARRQRTAHLNRRDRRTSRLPRDRDRAGLVAYIFFTSGSTGSTEGRVTTATAMSCTTSCGIRDALEIAPARPADYSFRAGVQRLRLEPVRRPPQRRRELPVPALRRGACSRGGVASIASGSRSTTPSPSIFRAVVARGRRVSGRARRSPRGRSRDVRGRRAVEAALLARERPRQRARHDGDGARRQLVLRQAILVRRGVLPVGYAVRDMDVHRRRRKP